MEMIIKRNMKLMCDEKHIKEIFSANEIMLIQNIKTIIQNFQKKGIDIVCRFNGGCVRDKLLGIEVNDIDISVEGIDFIEFTDELIKLYPTACNFGVFRRRDKNKNIENKRISIAHVKLFENFELDICNITPSPLLDAKRRDLTINALFFNINTYKIEDYIGGVNDLMNGIIKTPDSIDIIFGTDPLCFLRAFRFSAKFGKTIQNEILNPSKELLKKFKEDTKIHTASKELMKMIKDNNTLKILDLYMQSNIFDLLFNPQNTFHAEFNRKRLEIALMRLDEMNSNDFIINYDCIKQLFNGEKFFNEKMVVVMASIYFQNKTKTNIPRNLGLSNEISNSIKKVIYHTVEIDEFKNKELDIISVGIWMKSIGPEWLLVRTLLSNESLVFFDNIFVPFIFKNKLENVFEIIPLMNCFELGKLYGIDVTKKCKFSDGINKKDLLNKLQMQMIEWQINNPKGTADDYKKIVSDSI